VDGRLESTITAVHDDGSIDHTIEGGPVGGGPSRGKEIDPKVYRAYFPNFLPPAPEARSPTLISTPPPDPAALLAAGRRLRFVRDGGPLGKTFPAAVEAFVRVEGVNMTRRGIVIEDSEDAPHVLCTPQHSGHQAAANRLASLLADLGYRFDSVAD
jgi:hypothetical protein